MLSIVERCQQRLEQQQAANLLRQRLELQQRDAAYFQHQNSRYLSFMNYDYLALANHAEVIAAFQHGATRFGAASSASQLLGGHFCVHRELEEQIAYFANAEAALVFSSGYMANLAVFTALMSEKDWVWHDRLNHASLLDANRYSSANLKRFHHLDINDLSRKLKQSSAEQNWICSDAVFSMDGDIAPLPDLMDKAAHYNSGLIIDDAHGFGVLGKNGGGIFDYFNQRMTATTLLIVPFGKAIGSMGAAVIGNKILIDTILQFARSYIYTSALSPALALAAQTSLQLIQQQSWRRDYLNNLISHFRNKAELLDLPISNSLTPIQALIIGEEQKTLFFAKKLKNANILVSAVRPPTVAKNTSRLRFNLTVHHSKQDIDFLLETLASIFHDRTLQ